MENRDRLLEIIARMSGRKIVVFGDLVADRFIYARPRRISREAPVLILEQERITTVPGGAANAMANLATLGASVRSIGVVGTDPAGDDLLAALDSHGIELEGISRVERVSTPTKTRILAGLPHAVRQQIVRLDHDPHFDVDETHASAIATRLQDAARDADAAIISDYGYGTAEPALARILINAELPVILDSRFRMTAYRGVTAATPNEEEASAAAQTSLFDADDDRLREVGRSLIERLGSEALLITRGSLGMVLFESSANDPESIPVYGTDQIADVTGAGDTVIATFTLALAAGASFSEAAALSNIAGGLVVMKMGTATVDRDELRDAVSSVTG